MRLTTVAIAAILVVMATPVSVTAATPQQLKPLSEYSAMCHGESTCLLWKKVSYHWVKIVDRYLEKNSTSKDPEIQSICAKLREERGGIIRLLETLVNN